VDFSKSVNSKNKCIVGPADAFSLKTLSNSGPIVAVYGLALPAGDLAAATRGAREFSILVRDRFDICRGIVCEPFVSVARDSSDCVRG